MSSSLQVTTIFNLNYLTTMKNTLVLLLLILTIIACQDLEQFEETPKINLGATAEKTSILSVVSQGTKTTVQYNLTTGAKYSVQVYGFAAKEPVKTLPLTAQEEIVTKVYDFSELPDGLYDLTLTDIDGNSMRKPLIIKR